MALDKAIKHGKEKRQPHRKAKAIDSSCRNHWSCPYCESGRQHFDIKRRAASDANIKEWLKEEVMNYFEDLELIGEGAEEDAQWFLSTIRAYKDDPDRLLKTAKTFEGGLENDRLYMTRLIRLMEGEKKKR